MHSETVTAGKDSANVVSKVKTRERQFAVKEFKDKFKYSNLAKHSLDIFQKFKKIGAPTWTTCRIDQNEKQILMTLDGVGKNNFLISPENKSKDAKKLKKERIDTILEFEEFLKNFIQQLRNISNHSILLFDDCFLFRYNKNSQNIDVVIGDFDNVNEQSGWNLDELFEKNKKMFLNELNEFIDGFINPSTQDYYRQIVNKYK